MSHICRFLRHEKAFSWGPQIEFRSHSGGAEFSMCLKIFIFWKYNGPSFKWRIERFYTTLRKKRLVYEKNIKKSPSVGFWHARLYLRRLWDYRKNMGFCDHLRDAASGPKTYLGPY